MRLRDKVHEWGNVGQHMVYLREEHGRVEEKISEVEAELGGRVSRLEEQMNATDPESPGLAIRLDRIEQRIKFVGWLAGGGLISAFGVLGLLWKILGALAKTQ